ncbi:MAG: hypothetical protein UV80_C0003G0019 [Candidatus Peregrinibacteria bacterium GW2011_GWF2_43_17]|nr:MAG: hypothetical protein UV80_C0003G0019 [Candidatus Peregrinibacteria bacterium GW2011_GWF2_43_17]KKT19338.1 MAG: hypothetical protein UW03_C0020G0043 [Candidatus Peregrinibacteria bacterium GW2011_GWA2_43_8]HAU40156.1 hypothetical protein [Candidatus Peregrinibacteria bacterium]
MTNLSLEQESAPCFHERIKDPVRNLVTALRDNTDNWFPSEEFTLPSSVRANVSRVCSLESLTALGLCVEVDFDGAYSEMDRVFSLSDNRKFTHIAIKVRITREDGAKVCVMLNNVADNKIKSKTVSTDSADQAVLSEISGIIPDFEEDLLKVLQEFIDEISKDRSLSAQIGRALGALRDKLKRWCGCLSVKS